MSLNPQPKTVEGHSHGFTGFEQSSSDGLWCTANFVDVVGFRVAPHTESSWA